MLFSGFTVRYFTPIGSGNFAFNDIQTTAVEHVTGNFLSSGQELRIGLTGTTGNHQWYFAFRNGKIYDPEGRWFGSYDSDDYTTISGNFATGDYSYYLNDTLINAKGKKTPIYYNGWYVELISGATGVGDILITTSTITTTLKMQSGFFVDGIWSGMFQSEHSKPIVIRSGELLLPDAVNFEITGSGLSFNTGTNIIGANGCRVIKLHYTGTSGTTIKTGMYTIGLRIYTDYGFSEFRVSGSGVPQRSGYVLNGLSPTGRTDIVSTRFSGSGLGTFSFSTTYEDFNGTRQAKPYIVTLDFVSGFTGTFYPCTGLSIIDEGSGYDAADTVIYVFPEESGFPIIEINVLTGDSGNITGYTIVNTGYYYSGVGGAYYLEVAQGGAGTGMSFDADPLFGSAYTKAFSGWVTGWTGQFGTGTAALTGTQSHYYGSGTLPSGSDITVCDIVFSGTPDSAPVMYKITYSGLADTSDGISMYTGSGLIYCSG